MESWQRVEATEVETRRRHGEDAQSDMPGFQLARIETIDVTRQFPKDSAEALVSKLRSKWDISFPQAMIWGILACAAGFAITIVRERKQGTFLRLQVAPVSRAQIARRQGDRLLSRRDLRDCDDGRARDLAGNAAAKSRCCWPWRPSASPFASSAS